MPPADAFDKVKRFPAPAWEQQQQAQAQAQRQARQAAEAQQSKGKKGKTSQSQPAKPKKPRKQKQVNPARRRRQRRIAAVLAIIVLIALGAWFSITVLFKINKYEIQGEGLPYSEEQILEAFGHTLGDNLYGFSVSGAEERLETKLPYIEAADIRRRPPSTVVFRLTPAQEVYYLLWEGAYVVLNDTGKVLRTTGEVPEGVVRIDGLSYLTVEPGHPIKLDETAAQAAIVEKEAAEAAASASAAALSEASGSASDESVPASSDVPESQPEESQSEPQGEGEDPDASGSSMEGEESLPAEEPQPEATPEPAGDPAHAAESYEVLWELVEALNNSGLEGIGWIDVSDPLELRFGWQDRITVRLGPKSGVEEKMKALVALLTGPDQGLEEGDRGTMDMTLYLTTGECIFTPE